MYITHPCVRGDTGTFSQDTHEVVEEHPVSVILNGRNILTAMMSPTELEDFVTGFLFTEQIISSPGDIESVMVEKDRVSVLTKNPFRFTGGKKLILSGCGGSSSYLDTKRLPKITSDLRVRPEVVAAGMKALTDSALHRLTGGVHIVGLLKEENILHKSEDIGRHNALDKVIGFSIRNRIDPAQTVVLSSGRISSEMVRKCLVANIPIIASRGATTDLAIRIALENGLCVIGFIRGGKMNIYSHPERIVGTETACTLPG